MNHDSQHSPSPIIRALADWIRGNHVPDDVLYRIQQFGFIFPDASGKLELTPYGLQVLRENRLI